MQRTKILKSLALVFIGIAMTFSFQVVGQNVKLNPIKPISNKAITDEQQGILAVRNVKPSVVSISGSRVVKSLTTSATGLNTVNGTGFILETDGLIVTNSHVLEDPNIKFYVELLDGSQYEAKVVGQDKLNDVALLKIEARNLPVVKLGDSSHLETGQTVFAIGNSLGIYQNTVTKGVVSGLSRAVGLGDEDNPQPRLQNLVQTDAAINPGNSGGPLINMAGEVVGMNTLIDTGARGVGFAVPVNTIKQSVAELKIGGVLSRPYVGLGFLTINKAVQAVRQLKVNYGALVTFVVKGSPAQSAGLLAGDIVLKVNLEKLTEKNEFDSVITRYRPGDQVFLTIFRDNQELSVPVILTKYE